MLGIDDECRWHEEKSIGKGVRKWPHFVSRGLCEINLGSNRPLRPLTLDESIYRHRHTHTHYTPWNSVNRRTRNV